MSDVNDDEVDQVDEDKDDMEGNNEDKDNDEEGNAGAVAAAVVKVEEGCPCRGACVKREGARTNDISTS